MSFWDVLYSHDQPVIGMSPMDGVTDAPFRYMVAKYGRREFSNHEFLDSQIGGVDVLFTEFVSVDGLHFAEAIKRERILKDLIMARDLLGGKSAVSSKAWVATEPQTPCEVAQVFGNKPEFFAEAARLIERMGFDGIDINMGCPAKNVSENGCGAGLIRTPKLAQEIVLATKAATKLPVSVKTRIGVGDRSEMEEWIEVLCEVRPANISLHGRTLKQLYQGSADWEAIGRAAEIVHKSGLRILGNGDVGSLQQAVERVRQYGVDGVLIGRAAQGNPGVFIQYPPTTNMQMSTNVAPSREQRLAWAIEHAYVYEKVFKPNEIADDGEDARWFLPLRKHLAWYAHGFPGAVELRIKLMKTKSAKEVEETIVSFDRG